MNKIYSAQKITNLLLKIYKYLVKYEKTPNPEYIHLLRVSVKKLRSVLYFFRKTGTDLQSLPKKVVLQKLFKNAGKLREIQLNLVMLEQSPELVSLVEHLKNEFIQNTFTKKIPKYKQEVIKIMALLRLGFKLPKKKIIKDFFSKQLQKINTEFEQGKLHQFRMRIKKMMYVHEFLPENIQLEIPLNNIYMDQIQIQIGLWHDLSAAIEYFEKIKFLPAEFEIIKIKEKHAKEELLLELESFQEKIFIKNIF